MMPAALLTALVLTETVTTGQHLVIDSRLGGLAAAVVALRQAYVHLGNATMIAPRSELSASPSGTSGQVPRERARHRLRRAVAG